MYDVVFAENVTIEALNPHNFALKNEYIDNLISTAWLVVTRVAPEVEGIKVIKGFLSESYIRANFKSAGDAVFQHGKGLALELTWNDFTVDKATTTGLTLINTCIEPLYVVVDSNRTKLCVYRKLLTDKSELVQMIDGAIRKVKTIDLNASMF